MCLVTITSSVWMKRRLDKTGKLLWLTHYFPKTSSCPMLLWGLYKIFNFHWTCHISCSQYTYIFVLTFWGWRKKELHQNEKDNFKIYGVTTWLTNNYNTHISISHEVKTVRQEIAWERGIKYSLFWLHEI